jgi:hypothetical protein
MRRAPDRILVVQRDASGLFASFREHFGGWAEVVVDRRWTERRRARVIVMLERRGGERRRPLSERDDCVWRVARYRLAPRPPSMVPGADEASKTGRPAGSARGSWEGVEPRTLRGWPFPDR